MNLTGIDRGIEGEYIPFWHMAHGCRDIYKYFVNLTENEKQFNIMENLSCH
jgi:hypothetical protein